MLAGGGCGAGRANSGEAAVVGGDDFFGCSPPAGGLLPGAGRQLRREDRSPEVGVVPGSSAPGSECWPEEDALRAAVVRRSRGGRR